jgi:MinD-like ATPase involved in chromosome partitioning or flagellar assembly
VASNGYNPTTRLHVLLSGPAAHGVAVTLEHEPAISVIRVGEHDGSSVDVAVHVLESPSAPHVAEDVKRLREVADAPLILAAYGEPNGIVETGLAVGAADVLVLPQSAETLIFALRKAARVATATEAGKVVTVFSPKGGSGKTVLATNLAVAAARSGQETLLVDLDLQFGDSALTLAVAPRATITDLAASAGDLDGEKLKAFVCTDSRTGVAVLPAPQRPEEADMIGQAELAAILSAARNAYDAVVIDTGPLFDAAVLAALDHSDQLLLVSNPEVTSLKNVRIGLETIDRLGFARERVSLVANRLGAAGGVSHADIEQALDTKITFELPDDPEVPAAINRALPVVVADEDSRFARAIGELLPSVFPAPHATDDTGSNASHRRFRLRGRR